MYKPLSQANIPPQNSKADSIKFSDPSTTAFNDKMYPDAGSSKKRKTKDAKVSGAMSCYQGQGNSKMNKVEFLTSNNKRTKDENEIREKKLKTLVKQIIDSDSDV